MSNGMLCVIDEVPKYKKRSKSKGLPRSKHKHHYETVLLSRFYHGKNYKNGREEIHEYCMPTKVCVICGRVNYVDRDPLYYIQNSHPSPYILYATELSEKALALPKWYCEDYFGKFAKLKGDA